MVKVETEAVDMNMNTKQECVANEVVDEFLPKDLGDEQLELPVLDAGMGGTDLQGSREKTHHQANVG